RGFVVLKAGVEADPQALAGDLAQMIRDKIGPIATLSRLDIVAALPKTRSGKILRKTMRGLANGRDEPVPSTIDDPATLDALRPLLHGGGREAAEGRAGGGPPVPVGAAGPPPRPALPPPPPPP